MLLHNPSSPFFYLLLLLPFVSFCSLMKVSVTDPSKKEGVTRILKPLHEIFSQGRFQVLEFIQQRENQCWDIRIINSNNRAVFVIKSKIQLYKQERPSHPWDYDLTFFPSQFLLLFSLFSPFFSSRVSQTYLNKDLDLYKFRVPTETMSII